MNQATTQGAQAPVTLIDLLSALRKPGVAQALGDAMGRPDVHEQLQRNVYELNSLVLSLRESAFAVRVLGEGLASGLDLAKPEADGVRGLMNGLEQPLQQSCNKINQITGYEDY